VRELLNAAYAQEASERSGLFKIIAELADETSIDDLIARIEGKDPVARLHIINVLARFNTPKVSSTPFRSSSRTTANSFAPQRWPRWPGWTAPSTCRFCATCCATRKSRCRTRPSTWWCRPTIPTPSSTWSKCSRTRTNTPGAPRSRCLNVVGTAKSVKYLLEVIADSDWWVRTRAADALGKIGGPKVVDAVLDLIKDENQDIRRAAIEILNQTKDERAVAQLIEATKDRDWWVSERAVDALAEIGSTKALPRFIEMLRPASPSRCPP
jgi:HEAT repeat protein